jgi:hypothetical protein
MQNHHLLENFIKECKEEIGDQREPAIVIIRDNIIDFRYDRHGSQAVQLDADTDTITDIKKIPKEPWHGIKWLHVVYRTGPSWVVISDITATLIFLTTLSGLFSLRYRRWDFMTVTTGAMIFIIGIVTCWPN